MKDTSGKVIYVGKAKKLKNRVTSYFHGDHLPKVAAMISKIQDFDYIVVNSELEALVLENSLIKRHKPFYNILLKDDKGYPFVRIDIKSAYPDITMCPKSKDDGALYFGPFGARRKTRDLISSVKNALGLQDCSRTFPRDIGKERPCLNYHLKKCRGWCLAELTADDYRQQIDRAVLIFQGKSESLVRDLKSQMVQASDNLNFELAAQLRDTVKGLEALHDRQRVFSAPVRDTDVFGLERGAKCCFSVLKYIDGNLTDRDIEIIEEPIDEDNEALVNIIRQYYLRPGMVVPGTVLVQCDIEFREELELILSDYSGHSVAVLSPKRGEKRVMVSTAVLNASEEINRITSDEQKRMNILSLLQKTAGLEKLPLRIEAVDISNLGNTGIVAGMTTYINGKKSPKNYKKFNLAEVEGQNDFESIYRTISRRLDRYSEGDSSFCELPDLLLIDGGEKQVSWAARALLEHNVFIPLLGMVKDDRHRTRALVNCKGYEIDIKSNQALFSFIGEIQEETHRFSIEHQKKQREKSLSSELDFISGIGDKRKAALYNRFKSVNNIKNADISELRSILPENAAKNVYEYFHHEKEKE